MDMHMAHSQETTARLCPQLSAHKHRQGVIIPHSGVGAELSDAGWMAYTPLENIVNGIQVNKHEDIAIKKKIFAIGIVWPKP